MELFYRRLSSHVCVDFGSPPSETGGVWFCFGVFQQIYVVFDSRRFRGWNHFTGGSLVTFTSILVRLQAKREVVILFWCLSSNYTVYDSRRLRGWNRFAGGSLVTFATILVRLQAKREVGGYVLASFNKYMLCMVLAGWADGTVSPAAL